MEVIVSADVGGSNEEDDGSGWLKVMKMTMVVMLMWKSWLN